MKHVGASSTSHVFASPERNLRPLVGGTASIAGVYRSRVPARAETPPIDLVGYIGRCHHSLRVLKRIPKGAVIPVADALQHLIMEALDRGSEIA